MIVLEDVVVEEDVVVVLCVEWCASDGLTLLIDAIAMKTKRMVRDVASVLDRSPCTKFCPDKSRLNRL